MPKLKLTDWIFIALIGGFLVGIFLPIWAPLLKPFRALFLNGVKCIIAPLIFSTIVSGIAGAGSFKQLGLMGARAMIYFELVTTIALGYGLVAVNLLRPGDGIKITEGIPASAAAASATKLMAGGFIEHLLPTNLADAVVRGDVLQIVIFSSIFGFAVLSVGAKAKPVLSFSEGLADVMFKFTNYIMMLAPLGVGSAMAVSVAEHGLPDGDGVPRAVRRAPPHHQLPAFCLAQRRRGGDLRSLGRGPSPRGGRSSRGAPVEPALFPPVDRG